MDLEAYFRKVLEDSNWVDHALRVEVSDKGVTFYIHPDGVDGPTLDFFVSGHVVIPYDPAKLGGPAIDVFTEDDHRKQEAQHTGKPFRNT